MRHKTIYLWAFLVLSPGFLNTGSMAQKAWTLEECIQYAQDQNINIKRQDLLIQSSKSNYQTAHAGRLPRVNAWASHNLSSGKTINIEDYTYINRQYQDGNLGIRGDIPLFEGFGVLNSIRQQKFAFQAAIQESEKLRNSISIQVTSAFLQLLFAKELLQVAKEQHNVSLEQVESTRIFVEGGRMANSTLLEMQAQAAQDMLIKTQAESTLETSRLQLVHLMNLSDITSFRISHPQELVFTNSHLPDPVQLFQIAARDLPRIKGAELRVKSSEYGLAATKGLLYPSIGLDGVYYSRYSEMGVNPLDPVGVYTKGQQLSDNAYKQVSLSINFPILNQFQTKNRIAQAKITALDAKLALDAEKITLRQEIQQSYTDARNAWSKYLASEDAVNSIQQSFDFTKEKFDAGLATSVEYSVSTSQLIKTRSQLLQAKYEYILRLTILDFYQGNPITL